MVLCQGKTICVHLDVILHTYLHEQIMHPIYYSRVAWITLSLAKMHVTRGIFKEHSAAAIRGLVM